MQRANVSKCHRLSKSYCWLGKADQVMDARDLQNLSLSFPLSSKGYQYTEVFGRVMLQCTWLKTSAQNRGWIRHLKLALVLDPCTPQPKVIHFGTREGRMHCAEMTAAAAGEVQAQLDLLRSPVVFLYFGCIILTKR